MLKQKAKTSQAGLLIFLGWLTYMVSYFGKVNYSANITQIIDFYGKSKAQVGIAPTFFFFAYGIGQVVNGLLCKKYNIKWMIFGSLMISASVNFVIAVTTEFDIIKWLWMLNGISLSVLWPTLIRMLSESLPRKQLGKSSIAMGTTVALGTLITYGFSSVYAAISQFKLSFYTAAFSVLAVAIVWLCIYNRAVAGAKAEQAAETVEEDVEVKPKEAGFDHRGALLLRATVVALCFCAVGVNLIKDGLTTWVPSILKEEFSMSDSLSILLTLFLPVLAVFGNAFALRVHKKVPDYVNQAGLTFIVIGILVGAIIGFLEWKITVAMLAGLIAANFLVSTLNSMITSIFPLFMREKLNSGRTAGILNGFCYLGSTISSYGLGVIADQFGWTAVFWTLLGVCGAVCAVWCGYAFFKRFVQQKVKKVN